LTKNCAQSVAKTGAKIKYQKSQTDFNGLQCSVSGQQNAVAESVSAQYHNFHTAKDSHIKSIMSYSTADNRQKRSSNRTADSLGQVGMPVSAKELAATKWDAIVVGAGHNGLTCATYLARSGKQVLVLESRDRVGGACTLEEPWPGYKVSPCAYVAGLLHPLVMKELDFAGYGFEWVPAEGGLFVPFEDGSSIQLWDDEEKKLAELKKFAPGDVAGYRELHHIMDRVCEALRPADENDVWIGPAPTRETIEARLKNDKDAIALLFDWSQAEFLQRYLKDERLQLALMGQGVVGSFSSPFDRGTASIYLHHYSGRMNGSEYGAWGYVRGGMGMVSFILCDIARDAGVTVCSGTPVTRIIPGKGVELESGETMRAPVVISNADPIVTARLLGTECDPDWRKRVEGIPIEGCTVKLNIALSQLPDFLARPGLKEPHHLATINTPISLHEWKSCYETARAGGVPSRLWTEIYLQSAYDSGVTPEGKHIMSVFAQYVPHTFKNGDWDSHREEIGRIGIESIARYCSNLPDAVIAMEVLGPPDIEKRVGLTGGHIFQGECLPDYMWSKRLTPQTPMSGVFLCGACTHPGGSVIGINGRNAAMQVLATSEAAGRD
jgi:phytoene dehydrogenase-like protein